jgi:Glycosyltransferase sugar-binding region containing DXD motif
MVDVIDAVGEGSAKIPGVQCDKAMIPKLLHYVWVGGRLPAERREFVDTWRTGNPDFEVMQWDESNIDFSIPNIKRAHEKKYWAKVADIVRLAAVAKHGGIYFDTDFKVFKPLTPLPGYKCFFGFQLTRSSPDWVANGAFGATPGHCFIKQALQRVLTMKEHPLGLQKSTSFGPKLITRLLREHGLDHYSPEGVYVHDVFLLPTPMLYPFGWHEQFTAECVTEQTLAAHFWAESEGREPGWAATLPPPLRFLRRARTVLRKKMNEAGGRRE